MTFDQPDKSKPVDQTQSQADQSTEARSLSAVDLLKEKPAKDNPQEVQKVADNRPPSLHIENHALILSLKDQDFDRKLNYAAANFKQDFDTLKITDVPTNAKVNYWQDPKGFFLWVKDGGDGNKRHYIPSHLQHLELPQEKTTFEKLRLEVNDAYARQTFGDMASFNRSFNPSYDGGASSLKYFAGMSRLSDVALAKQEQALRDAVKTSDNPYFKIYLADTLMAGAVKPVIDGVMSGRAVDLNNPVTLRKIDEAISLLDAAHKDSGGQLGTIGRFPQRNIYEPLMPGVPYWNSRRYPDQFYGFWGGSYDQSQARSAALTVIRNHIVNNSFPRFQLPPDLPPRNF